MLAPTISETGITAPTYSEILSELQTQYRAIFGNDVYLGNDSQDGQFLGIVSAAINDSNAAAIACYNAFSPATAKGTGLSSVVKINGISRLVASKSTANVDVVGVAGTTIDNGIIADANGNKWTLPASVVIPSGGLITVTATSKVDGAISAPANTINKISTPAYGWQTVTNPLAATPGQPVESDAALRVRQARSVALPSLTVMEGIAGAVSAVPGVSQVAAYENDTNATDINGLPAHSISIVAQGGDSASIASAIAQKKTPGAYLFGSTSVLVLDTIGIPQTIRYSVPVTVPILVEVRLTALSGYTSGIAAQIQSAVSDYINALKIGQSVMLPRLYVPAQLSGGAGSSSYEILTIKIAADPATPIAADVAIAFDHLATCLPSSVSVVVV